MELLTAKHYFNKVFPVSGSVLDACAGTGRYSFYLANTGYMVTACDLVPHNVEIIKANPNADKLADSFVCNVLDLTKFAPESFDIVLCMGALYHLRTETERKSAVLQCTRVLKKGGILALAYNR